MSRVKPVAFTACCTNWKIAQYRINHVRTLGINPPDFLKAMTRSTRGPSRPTSYLITIRQSSCRCNDLPFQCCKCDWITVP